MKNYLLIISESTEANDAWEAMTPEQMQAGLQAYMAYSQRLVDEGRMIAGEGLSRVGKVLRPSPAGVTVTDGPHVLATEMVGGFFFIKANSIEEAAEIAKDCPALHHGATVEVREQMEY
jgi:hypothetical protein